MAGARIVIPGWFPALDSNGFAIPGATLYLYENRTTQLASIFADQDLTTPLANPLVANASGRFPDAFADDAALYSVSIQAPYGVPGIPFTYDDFSVAASFGGQGGPYILIPLSESMSPTEVRQRIQDYVDRFAGQRRVVIPAGTWEIDEEIKQPSNSWVSGQSADLTTVRMATASNRRNNVFTNASNDRTTGNTGDTGLVLENITLDGNRTGVINVDGAPNTSGCGVGWAAVRNSILRKVKVKSCYNHGIAIDGNVYVTGQTNFSPVPSAYIRVEDCEAWDNGDDQITTHWCAMIWLVRCIGRDSAGSKVAFNSNAIEVDDGSRFIWVIDCAGIRCDNALQIKGHNYAPAPYNVTVDGFRGINCRYGIEIRHTGMYGGATDEDGDGETEDEDGNPIEFTGSSPTARNVRLSNIEIVAPRSRWQDNPNVVNNPAPADYGVRIRSYENVQIVNLSLSDGSLDLGDDFEPATELLSWPMRIYSGARNVQIRNLSFYGFTDAVRGLYVSGSFAGGLDIDGVQAVNGPDVCVYASSAAERVTVDRYSIFNSGDSPGETPIYVRGPDSWVGSGTYRNFDTGPNCQEGVTVVRASRSSGDAAFPPQRFQRFITEERTGFDIGQGEGAAHSWWIRRTGEDPIEVGRYGMQKSSALDTSLAGEFGVWIINAAGDLALRNIMSVRHDGTVITPFMPVYADNAAAITGGLTAGCWYRTSGGDLKIVV